MWIRAILVSCLVEYLFSLKTLKTDKEIKLMMERMLTDYDPRIRPDYSGAPIIVNVDATVLSVTKLDAINMMFTIDMFFRQRWSDKRLVHELNDTLTLMVGTKHPSDIIWVPDTVFINSVTSSMHKVTVNNHKVDIEPDGQVFWGTRVTVSPMCLMDLRAYPMDSQECYFQIVSYAYSSQHLKYKWQKIPGIIFLDKTMSQFELTGFSTKGEELHYVAGNYTVLTGNFTFSRLMGFAILQVYIPCIAIVFVSWISLWINKTCIPARVALCITTLLTISTIWGSVNSRLPQVNYVKAIDIYLMTSFCFVLSTLMEYTIVLNSEKLTCWMSKNPRSRRRRLSSHASRAAQEADSFYLLHSSFTRGSAPHRSSSLANNRREMALMTNNVSELMENGVPYDARIRKMANGRASVSNSPSESKSMEPDFKVEEEKEKKRREEQIAFTIETVARVLFPLAYLVFNVSYWAKYVGNGDPHAD